MNKFVIPICFKCERFKDDYTCEAFPDAIPDEILLLEHDHHDPYPGDNGLQFKEK